MPGAKVWWAAAAYVSAFFFVVWVKVAMVRTGYALQDLESEHKSLHLSLSELEFKMGSVASYPVLYQKAKAMGFLMPGEYALNKIRHADKREREPGK